MENQFDKILGKTFMNTAIDTIDTMAGKPLDETVYAKVAWRLIPLLFLCYVLAYLDRVNVGFAKLQMQSELQFSDSIYGLGAGIFFIGYFLFEVPSNLILHKTGARLWIARIMVTWGMISASFIWVDSVWMFYLFRFLLGLAEAGFFPGIIFYLTYWFPAQRRARIVALFMSAAAVSSAFGGPISGWIMKELAGINGWSGWQWLFLLEGLPSIVVGVWVLFYLDDGIRKANWLTDDEKQLLERRITADSQEKPIRHLGQACRDPRVWLLCLVYFCFVSGLYGVSFWLPQLIKNTGVNDLFNVGLLSAIPWGIGAVGMILIGHHSDRSRERRWHIAFCGLVGAAALAVTMLFGNDTLVALTALTVATLGILGSFPVFWNIPTAFLAGTAAAGGIAIINSFGNLGGFAAPYLMGWLNDLTQNTTAGIYCLAGAMALAAVLVLIIPRSLFNREDVKP
jgi:D-galactonate transporter